jgi:hypothetical protein
MRYMKNDKKGVIPLYMRYIEYGSMYTQEYIRGKITRAPMCLGTMLNTYKIHDVLYVPRGMYDLHKPSTY